MLSGVAVGVIFFKADPLPQAEKLKIFYGINSQVMEKQKVIA